MIVSDIPIGDELVAVDESNLIVFGVSESSPRRINFRSLNKRNGREDGNCSIELDDGDDPLEYGILPRRLVIVYGRTGVYLLKPPYTQSELSRIGERSSVGRYVWALAGNIAMTSNWQLKPFEAATLRAYDIGEKKTRWEAVTTRHIRAIVFLDNEVLVLYSLRGEWFSTRVKKQETLTDVERRDLLTGSTRWTGVADGDPGYGMLVANGVCVSQHPVRLETNSNCMVDGLRTVLPHFASKSLTTPKRGKFNFLGTGRPG
jgi:hypothetical protein